MKFVYPLVCALWLFTLPVKCQISNNSFENWTSMGNYEIPDQWGTLNELTSSSGVYTATKGTPGNPGNSYLQVTSRSTAFGVVPGIVVSGLLDTATMQPKSGFAFSQRPQELTGNWQYMSFSGSPGAITVTLTRWDSANAQRETVASAVQTLPGMVMSWSYFSISLVYFTGNLPDTCMIILEASGPAPSDNDYLWVDNLNFSGTVIGMGDSYGTLPSVMVYPNPATSSTQLEIFTTENEVVNISVRDVNGRQVQEVVTEQTQIGRNVICVSIAGLRGGSYIIVVESESEAWYAKLVIAE
jgi:hypothetical protein